LMKKVIALAEGTVKWFSNKKGFFRSPFFH